jgi:arabinogalactan endo-1,4-beta-galactosidase
MGYGLGMWNANGQPTTAIRAFLDTPPARGLVYNSGFEYTAPTPTPLGWTTAGDADADLTQNYGVSSLHQLGHQRATAYQVRTFQVLTNVPNGTYTLRAMAQSTGGQTVCQLYATGFGGTELATTLPVSVSAWVPVQVAGITVTNGQCEIGLRSTSPASASASLDDVEFVATTATATRAGATSIAAAIYPNPAGSQRSVAFTLERDETVQLALFSLTGQLVRELAPARRLSRGPQVVPVSVAGLAPGTYLLKISHGSRTEVRKMMQL